MQKRRTREEGKYSFMVWCPSWAKMNWFPYNRALFLPAISTSLALWAADFPPFTENKKGGSSSTQSVCLLCASSTSHTPPQFCFSLWNTTIVQNKLCYNQNVSNISYAIIYVLERSVLSNQVEQIMSVFLTDDSTLTSGVFFRWHGHVEFMPVFTWTGGESQQPVSDE